jgi:hypothetical protein
VGRVREADGDSRRLWQTLSRLLTPRSALLQNFTAQQFATIFKDKVDTIRAATAGALVPESPRLPCQSTLTSYSPVTVADICHLLSQTPNKQCTLDSVPAWLVKALKATLPDILTRLINSSLLSGNFPPSKKRALVMPVLKIPQMDPTVSSNYRPMSNLSFISKLLDRVVVKQLTTYLDANDLIPSNQSAYRRNHSTGVEKFKWL